MSLAVSSESESEVEPFITQTQAAWVAVLQLSFRKTILNPHSKKHKEVNCMEYTSLRWLVKERIA